MGRHWFGCPATGTKMNDITGQTTCRTFRVHLLKSFLFSFVASSVVFDVLEFSLNWFFTLIAFDKKGITVPMQIRAIFFSGVKTNYIIAKHVYTRNLLFRSFAIACFDSGTWMDSCQEATWQVCVTELGQQLFLFISGNIQISCQLHRVCFLRYW